MKKLYYYLLLAGIFHLMPPSGALCQDNKEEGKKSKSNTYVNAPFDAGYLLNNQTVFVPSAKTLEFMIQHRFGNLSSETFDLVGLYAPSNIRLGIGYCITDFLQVGIGTTKANMLQDVNWKWSILRQTKSGSIPVGLTYYGNAAVNVREHENFGMEYSFPHRLSYFHQVLVSRRFGPRISLQAALSFAHFNQVDTIAFNELKHNNLAVLVSGKYKITPQLGLVLEYDHPLTTPLEIDPNACIGIEISTLLHSFQIFVGSYSKISPQHNMMFNTNNPGDLDFLIGFNINRYWKF